MILVTVYFTVWTISIYTYWVITDWFDRPGFMNALSQETAYWFESNNNFVTAQNERILEKTIENRL